jgi:hypothetical protein
MCLPNKDPLRPSSSLPAIPTTKARNVRRYVPFPLDLPSSPPSFLNRKRSISPYTSDEEPESMPTSRSHRPSTQPEYSSHLHKVKPTPDQWRRKDEEVPATYGIVKGSQLGRRNPANGMNHVKRDSFGAFGRRCIDRSTKASSPVMHPQETSPIPGSAVPPKAQKPVIPQPTITADEFKVQYPPLSTIN